MVYEEGSYIQRYVYGLNSERVSAEFFYYDETDRLQYANDPVNETNQGENPASDFATEDIVKIYYFRNLLDSSMLAMDQEGEIITHALYDEWDKPLTEPRLDGNFAGIDNINNYTGYTYDYLLDIYFAQNRFYNPDTRQFITQEPIKDGMNWYGYCEGNPLVWVDPWGFAKSGVPREFVEFKEFSRAVIAKGGRAISLPIGATVSVRHKAEGAVPIILYLHTYGGKKYVSKEDYDEAMAYLDAPDFVVLPALPTNPISPVAGSVEDINNADIQTRKEFIWNYLVDNFGVSEIHAAAIMGNIQQESNFSPTNAQNSCGYPGDNNPEYIAGYETKDGVGWGLIQWTYYTRKQGLLDYANEKGTNVGDTITQLEYLLYEVNNVSPYKSRFQSFLQITDIDEATAYFCKEIEQAGTPHAETRKQYANAILAEFGGTP